VATKAPLHQLVAAFRQEPFATQQTRLTVVSSLQAILHPGKHLASEPSLSFLHGAFGSPPGSVHHRLGRPLLDG